MERAPLCLVESVMLWSVWLLTSVIARLTTLIAYTQPVLNLIRPFVDFVAVLSAGAFINLPSCLFDTLFHFLRVVADILFRLIYQSHASYSFLAKEHNY